MSLAEFSTNKCGGIRLLRFSLNRARLEERDAGSTHEDLTRGLRASLQASLL